MCHSHYLSIEASLLQRLLHFCCECRNRLFIFCLCPSVSVTPCVTFFLLSCLSSCLASFNCLPFPRNFPSFLFFQMSRMYFINSFCSYNLFSLLKKKLKIKKSTSQPLIAHSSRDTHTAVRPTQLGTPC